jgi:hypothetical protein
MIADRNAKFQYSAIKSHKLQRFIERDSQITSYNKNSSLNISLQPFKPQSSFADVFDIMNPQAISFHSSNSSISCSFLDKRC